MFFVLSSDAIPAGGVITNDTFSRHASQTRANLVTDAIALAFPLAGERLHRVPNALRVCNAAN